MIWVSLVHNLLFKQDLEMSSYIISYVQECPVFLSKMKNVQVLGKNILSP